MDLLLRLTKELKAYKDEKHLLGVSGGLDSMALAQIFCHFREYFDFQFSVAHIHHGPSEQASQLDYRFKAWNFVHDFCREKNIPFHSNYDGENREDFLKSFKEPLKSESDFRNLRLGYFNRFIDGKLYDRVVLGHHRDDLLETRLIRLIRGVGPAGLESMKSSEVGLLRPLLGFSRSELKLYMKKLEAHWLEDPSNDEDEYLRNWMRKVWLPQLEEKRSGSLQSLSRSLDLILENSQDQSVPLSCIQGDEILLSEFLLLSSDQKSQLLATYMRDQGLKNYGLSHIKELMKRLDSEKKSLTFQLLGRPWSVDAGRLKVLGLG